MSSGRQAISIDIQSLGDLKYGVPASRHDSLLEEVLQLSLCKYRARPHWALSTNRMLLGSSCPLRDAYGDRFDQFMERRARFDPQGLFLHPGFVRIASKSPPDNFYPGEYVMQHASSVGQSGLSYAYVLPNLLVCPIRSLMPLVLGCAPKEDCFCIEDVHCSPGFECAPGQTFKEFNVCRLKQARHPNDEL